MPCDAPTAGGAEAPARSAVQGAPRPTHNTPSAATGVPGGTGNIQLNTTEVPAFMLIERLLGAPGGSHVTASLRGEHVVVGGAVADDSA